MQQNNAELKQCDLWVVFQVLNCLCSKYVNREILKKKKTRLGVNMCLSVFNLFSNTCNILWCYLWHICLIFDANWASW